MYELARKHKIQPERLCQCAQTLQDEFDAMASDHSMLDQLTEDEQTQREAYRAKAKPCQRDDEKAGAFTKAIDHMHALGIKEGELSIVFRAKASLVWSKLNSTSITSGLTPDHSTKSPQAGSKRALIVSRSSRPSAAALPCLI